MPMFADVLLVWLALQAPVGMLLGRLLKRRQPPAPAPSSSFPATPEEGSQ